MGGQKWTQDEAVKALEAIGYGTATDHIICHYDLPCPNGGSVVMYRKRHGHIDVYVVKVDGTVEGPKTYNQSRSRR